MQVNDEGRLLRHGCRPGEGVRSARLETRLEVAVLKRYAVDGRLLHRVGPAGKRRYILLAQLVENQAAYGLNLVTQRLKLGHAQTVLDVARAHDAALDTLGETNLRHLKSHMTPRADPRALLVTGVRSKNGHITGRVHGALSPALLAHKRLTARLEARTVDVESGRRDLGGVHLAR